MGLMAWVAIKDSFPSMLATYILKDCGSCNILTNNTPDVSLNTSLVLFLFQDKHHDAAHEIIETIR